MNDEINPDSTILQQSEGQWQKYLSLVVHKLAPDGVKITAEDMQNFIDDEDKVLLTHGHIDSIEFKMVTREAAERLAEDDAKQRGQA